MALTGSEKPAKQEREHMITKRKFGALLASIGIAIATLFAVSQGPAQAAAPASYKPAALISKTQSGLTVERVTAEEKAVRKLAGEFWTCKTVDSAGVAIARACYNTSDAGSSWRIEGTTSSPDELSVKFYNPPGAWTTSSVYANYYYSGTSPASGYLGGTADGDTNYFLLSGSTIPDTSTGKFQVAADGLTWCVYIVHNSGSFTYGAC